MNGKRLTILNRLLYKEENKDNNCIVEVYYTVRDPRSCGGTKANRVETVYSRLEILLMLVAD